MGCGPCCLAESFIGPRPGLPDIGGNATASPNHLGHHLVCKSDQRSQSFPDGLGELHDLSLVKSASSPAAYSTPTHESRWSRRQSSPAFPLRACFPPLPSIHRSWYGPPRRPI